MDLDPKVPAYHTSDQTSFAYTSAKDRWPVILTGALDDVHRAVSDCDDAAKVKEGKVIIENIAKLKYELQHNRPLVPLDDDGQPDVAGYNEELGALGTPMWFDLPWLFGECYLYRRLNTLFSRSEHWKSYDVFARQKMSTFRSSRAAVVELAEQVTGLAARLSASGAASSAAEREAAERLLFEEMCEICLWGNATDLSLLTSLSYEDIQKLQGSKARQASKQNILVDDLSAAFDALRAHPGPERRVDIVLDNAGFELYVDLVLASYLLTAQLATQVVLHPKCLPWFVSDVIPADFGALLNVLANPRAFYETPSPTSASRPDEGAPSTPLTPKEEQELTALFATLARFQAEGQIIIRPHRAWTHAGSYWRLPRTAPALVADLRGAALVIFKGDLNYRKLTGDVAWDPTTPFAQALGPLGGSDGGGAGLRCLALRTCKADVVVGLAPGQDERLRAAEGGGGDSGCRKWAWSGKWAVVQFCDGTAKQA